MKQDNIAIEPKNIGMYKARHCFVVEIRKVTIAGVLHRKVKLQSVIQTRTKLG